jgi:mannose-6-phosphate isomerase-like protein (cupin superfamily)
MQMDTVPLRRWLNTVQIRRGRERAPSSEENTMKWCITAGALLTLAVALAASGLPLRVHYVSGQKVAETMAKGGQIISDEGFVVLANRRGAADAELHDTTNHVFIIVEGEATFVTGGTLVAPRETGRGQVRAKGIEGGQTHQLRKGDVITIPAKTPHWWKEVPSGTVGYYAVNLEK